jgi:hypothetical membrane protein
MSAPVLVARGVRPGGVLLVFGAAQFIAAMVLVQSRYAGYSLSQNYISDLGGVHSPWALGFDASVILLGVCAIFGVLLIWSAFEPGRTRLVGLGFLLIAGIGAIGVGVFPETTPVLNGGMHEIVSDVAFIGSGVGLTVLSFAMKGERWRVARPLTLACGAVTLVAIVLFSANTYLGIGPGGMERVIVAPVLLFALVEGAHLARLPRYAVGGRGAIAA